MAEATTNNTPVEGIEQHYKSPFVPYTGYSKLDYDLSELGCIFGCTEAPVIDRYAPIFEGENGAIFPGIRDIESFVMSLLPRYQALGPIGATRVVDGYYSTLTVRLLLFEDEHNFDEAVDLELEPCKYSLDKATYLAYSKSCDNYYQGSLTHFEYENCDPADIIIRAFASVQPYLNGQKQIVITFELVDIYKAVNPAYIDQYRENLLKVQELSIDGMDSAIVNPHDYFTKENLTNPFFCYILPNNNVSIYQQQSWFEDSGPFTGYKVRHSDMIVPKLTDFSSDEEFQNSFEIRNNPFFFESTSSSVTSSTYDSLVQEEQRRKFVDAITKVNNTLKDALKDNPDLGYYMPIVDLQNRIEDILDEYEKEQLTYQLAEENFAILCSKFESDVSEDELDELLAQFETVPQSGYIDIPTFPQAGLFSMFNDSTEADISKLIAAIQETIPEVKDTGAQVRQTLSEIEQKIVSLSSSDNASTKALLEKLGKEIGITSAADTMGKGISLLFLVASCVYYNENKDDVSKALFGGAVVVNVIVNRETVGEILQSVSSLFTSSPQAANDVVTGLVLGLFGLSFNNLKLAQLPSSVVSMLNNFERVEKSLGNVLDFVIGIFSKLASYIVEDVHLPKCLQYFKIKQDHIKEYVLKVDEILNKVRMDTFDYTEENHIDLVHAIHAGQLLMIELPNSEAGCKAVLVSQLHSLDKIRTEFARVFSGSGGFRQEPFSLMTSGGPCTYKTISIDHIINEIAPRMLKPKELELFKQDRSAVVYTRQMSQKYYDGYRNSVKIMVMDDFLQQVEFPAEHLEVSDFMSAMSSWNKSLHMASMEKKGNTFMNTKLVIGTTNLLDIKSDMIVSQNALKRRVHAHFVVVPKDEFVSEKTKSNDLMNRRFDITKLPIGELGITSIQPENALYYEYNTLEGCYSGRVLTFGELCDYVVESIEIKELQYLQMKRELEVRFSRACKGFEAQGGLPLDVVIKPKASLLNTSSKMPRIPLDDVTRACCILEEYCGEENEEGNEEPLQRLNHMLDIFGNRSLANADMMHRQIKLYTLINTYGNEFCLAVSEGDVTKYIKSVERITMEFGPKVHIDVNDVIGMVKKSFFSKILEVKNYFDTPILGHIKGAIKSVKPFVPLILFSAAFITGTTVAVKQVFKKDDTEEHVLEVPQSDTQPQSEYNAKTMGQKPVRQRSLKEAKIKFSAQMGYGKDRSGIERVDKFIQKNVYNMYVDAKRASKLVKFGFVTFVKGTVILAPLHFGNGLLQQLDSGIIDHDDKVVFTNTLGTHERKFTVTIKEFITNITQTTNFDSLDLMLVEMPYKRVNEHTSILELFPTREQASKKTKFEARLVLPHDKGTQYYFGIAKGIVDHRVKCEKLEPYSIKTAYAYSAATDAGDCGGLLTELNAANSGPKIFGMHVCGNAVASLGISTVITREDIEEGMLLIEGITDLLLEKDFEAQGSFVFMDKFEQYEDLEKPVHAVTKTNIIKSELYECFGPATKKPAKLKTFTHEGKIIDPYSNALSKYNNGHAFVDPDVLEAIVLSHYDFLVKVSTHRVEKRILTFEEAVKGIVEEPDFKGIALGTSPGYPYIHQKQSHLSGKHFWFGYDGYDLSTKEALDFREECDFIIESYKRKIRVPIYFTNNLKDETRPLLKVMAGKTRLFNGSSMSCLTTVRQWFGSFCMFLTKNRIYNGVALGVNPYSDEWHAMKMHLNDHGQCVGAGDYAGFDGSQIAQILWAILDCINLWYDDGEENQLIRRMMWYDVVNSTHIKHKEVYRWHGSLPSGHPLTPVINCLYNHFAFRYCWYKLQGEYLSNLWYFDTHVNLIVLGDDNIFGVSDEMKEVFNEFTIVPHMAELNLTYTPEHKGEQGVSLRTIEEVEFLKRTFRYSPIIDRYVAPLRLEVILEMVYWTKRKNSRQITIDNVDCALRELSLHGKEIFFEQSQILIKALEKRMDESPFSSSFQFYFDKTIDSQLEF